MKNKMSIKARVNALLLIVVVVSMVMIVTAPAHKISPFMDKEETTLRHTKQYEPDLEVPEHVSEDISEFIEYNVEHTHVTFTVPEPRFTHDDLLCMAIAIYNEAGGDECSDDTRRMVGYVILNRVNDPRFENSIRDVLEEKGQYGKFDETGVVFDSRCTEPGESQAVARAYRIAEEVLRCEEIPIPETVVFESGERQGVSLYKYQDGLYFCHAEEVN